MGRKRSPGSNAILWWALSIVVAAFFGWLIFQNSHTQPPPLSASINTNRLDLARGSNLLNWLNTNFVAAPTNFATPTNATTPPVASPATNRISTNRPPIILTNSMAIKVVTPPSVERPVRSFLEAQIALARMAISCGPVDGVVGFQTRAALRAFQLQNRITQTGDLDPATSMALRIIEPVFTNYTITTVDLARLKPVSASWMGKSQQETLDYETALELVAELHQASQNLVKSLNPTVNWTNPAPFTVVRVPNIPRPVAKQRAGFIRIALAAKTLEAFDAESNLLAHFPCSIAARVEKRPIGQLTVVTGAENPNYTFDPAVFPESEEAREIDHKLIIPPGPNNPVGTAWISLDKPGYGIHGTPRPEQVGRTESHGCFRLANWNAEYLLKIVWAGLPVHVVP